jgi:hypothetical protein
MDAIKTNDEFIVIAYSQMLLNIFEKRGMVIHDHNLSDHYPLETIFREKLKNTIHDPKNIDILSEIYEVAYETEDFKKTFSLIQFMAPFVIVKKEDKRGFILFIHNPKCYFGFKSNDAVMKDVEKNINEILAGMEKKHRSIMDIFVFSRFLK